MEVTMPEKPILFKGPMVRAILEGRKTQTRRVVKHNPFYGEPDWERAFPDGLTTPYLHVPQAGGEYGDKTVQRLYCPYDPGDTLWVRETWAEDFEHNRCFYRADSDDGHHVPYEVSGAGGFGGGVGLATIDTWRPSIYMPRKYSRITLEVTGVRVERVRSITEEDALAEGVTWELDFTPQMNYAELWNSINAKRGYGWESNPWCWVVEFRRVDPC
jgi:hypothetical protein